MNFNPQQYFFLAFLAAVSLLVLAMIFPYLKVLALSAAFAVAFKPLHRRLHSFIKGYNGLAAFLTTVVSVVVVFIPILIIGVLIFSEAKNLLSYLSTGGYQSFNDDLLLTIRRYFPSTTVNLAEYSAQIGQWLGRSIGPLLSGTLSALLNFFIGILAFFYILKDGDRFARALVKISPLQDDQDLKILERLESAVYSIFTGTVIVAVVQGLVAGIGMAIFGVPNPTLWGSVAAVSALIPGVGTALVLVPAVAYVAIFGKLGLAIGLAFWGAILVGFMDNLLRPKLIARGFKVHPFLILLSVIGGISFFGPIGFLLGPLTLSLLIALLDISQLLVSQQIEN